MMKNVVQKIQKIPFLFMLVLVFFTCISASAQIQIKGTVVSANDSEPMIGVAILEEGTSNGRITDLNGNYSIQVRYTNNAFPALYPFLPHLSTPPCSFLYLFASALKTANQQQG